MRNGLLFYGYWQRAAGRNGDALTLNHNDGRPIALKPGRSWITVMRNLDHLGNQRYAASAGYHCPRGRLSS